MVKKMQFDKEKYKGVIFDLDGTLIDSMYVWRKVVASIYEKNGIEADVDADMKRYHAMKVSEVFAYIHEHWHTAMTIEQMNGLADSILEDEYTNIIPALDGAVEFVQWCVKNGVRCAVVTSSPMRLVRPVLERLGLYQDMDAIESAEDLHLSKHDPQIFERALRTMDTNVRDTLFFEDSRYALETADRMGMDAVGMKTKSEPYDDRVSIWNFSELAY